MSWLSKMVGNGHSQMIEASASEVIRTRNEIVLLRRQIDTELPDALRYKKEARLRQIIGIAIARYFIKGDRSPTASIPYEDVRIDSNPDWIPDLIARREVSEPEFMAFKHFSQDSGTILDIGANYGYAAASIWAAGAASKILSFEPNQWHIPCLQRIKELKPGNFDYISIGIGSAARETRFVMPVIEGIGISALSSASIEAETDWTIPENVLHHMMHDHPALEAPRLQFAEVVWRTERLDDILTNRRFEIDLSNITAIKIDVEGFEADVLDGAQTTLGFHSPLVMIEGANRNPAVVECLSSIGYRYAEFSGGNVILSNRPSARSNGFFLHEAKLGHYEAIGLLRP